MLWVSDFRQLGCQGLAAESLSDLAGIARVTPLLRHHARGYCGRRLPDSKGLPLGLRPGFPSGKESALTETSHDTADLLSKTNIFSGLSRRQLKRVIAQSREVDHEAGHEIALEGVLGLAFHLLLSGEVVVSIGSKEVRRLHRGQYFGEIAMIDGKPRSATVTVTEPTRTLVVPHYLFVELIEEEPAFTRDLLSLLCARLREADSLG